MGVVKYHIIDLSTNKVLASGEGSWTRYHSKLYSYTMNEDGSDRDVHIRTITYGQVEEYDYDVYDYVLIDRLAVQIEDLVPVRQLDQELREELLDDNPHVVTFWTEPHTYEWSIKDVRSTHGTEQHDDHHDEEDGPQPR